MMKRESARATILLVAVITVGLTGVSAARYAAQVRSVPFGSSSQPFVSLLNGPPVTRSLHSGLVTLQPGSSVGTHTTGTNEEMLIPLNGDGELRSEGHPVIQLKPGLITYAPPHTKHDVVNTGTTPLRYIYVTAKAE